MLRFNNRYFKRMQMFKTITIKIEKNNKEYNKLVNRTLRVNKKKKNKDQYRITYKLHKTKYIMKMKLRILKLIKGNHITNSQVIFQSEMLKTPKNLT